MGSNSKGDANERELVNHLDDAGWTVMRAPASGSGTDRELPDVLAGKDGVFIAVEAKRSSSGAVYVQKAEVEALLYFCRQFGALPQLAFRFDEKPGDPSYGANWPGHYFFSPDECHQTTKSYRMKKGTALADGVPIGGELFDAMMGEKYERFIDAHSLRR